MAWSCGAGAVDELTGTGSAVGMIETRARHRAAEPGAVGQVMDTLPIVADLPAYGRHAERQPAVPEPRIGSDDHGDRDGGAPAGPGPASAGAWAGRRRRSWLHPLRAAGRAGGRRTAERVAVPVPVAVDRPSAAAAPLVLTATIASPTGDVEAARAKLWVQLREQLAVRSPAAVVDEGALVVTEPRESSDSYGRVWFWFRGTVQVTSAPAEMAPVAHPDPVGEPAPWPLRPAPRRHGHGWSCHLTSPAHASRVRRGLRTRLQEGIRTGDCTQDAGDDLMLAFEELTSNAFRHGAGAVDVTIADTAAGWLLLVEDEAPDRPPHPAAGRDPVLGGMGLGMVAGLALDVGWQPSPGRKSVWAELPSHR